MLFGYSGASPCAGVWWCAPSRGAGRCGEGRGLCGSAAGQNPLSLFGCAEKRKRLLMVSREKTLAAAFQAPPETPFSAFYGGYWGADLSACVHSTVHSGPVSWGRSRILPASVFAAAVRWLRKIGNVGGTPPQMPGCGSEKRTAAHPGGTRSSDDVKS